GLAQGAAGASIAADRPPSVQGRPAASATAPAPQRVCLPRAGSLEAAAMTVRTALYAGSFDPLTNGHLDVLKASLAIADTIYAAIGIQAAKKPLFSFEERVALIEAVTQAEFGEAGSRRIKVV